MMKYLVYKILVFLFILVTSCMCSTTVESDSQQMKNSTETPPILEHIAVQKWKAAEIIARKYSASAVKSILPYAIRVSQNLNLTSSCTRGLLKFLSGIKQLKLWAFKMLDSSGKLPNGLYSGSINSLGDYDECITTSVPNHFQGQYCTVEITPPLPERRRFVSTDSEIPEFINITAADSAIGEFLKLAMYYYHLKFRSSVCVPSTCSTVEVKQLASEAMKQTGVEFNVNIPNCETKVEKIIFTKSQIAVLIILLLLLILGLSATVVDVFMKLTTDEESKSTLSIPVKCLLCFSFYTNTLRLLKKDDSQDSIKIFHGMKVITILWVILNHTYYYLNFQACSSLLEAREKGKEVLFQLVINGFLNVETFFFISSVLVAYGVMKMKEQKLNIFLYIFRRLWRLTPPFMLVIACVFLLPHLGSGPVWKETVTQRLTEKCQTNWWANLLYINNFIPTNDTCLEWHWYIPVDTHLYFLSLVILIPLKQNPRLAFTLNGILFLCSVLITAVSNVYYKLHPTAIYVFNHPEDINYFVDNGYFRTYLHCSTYCVGLTVGYIIATKEKKRLPLFTVICGWTLAFVFALAVLYGVYDWNQGNTPNLLVSTLYTCTNKLVWSLALAWVTIACMTGNGGIVTTLLSWQAFVPFGRLTYMAYLIHPLIQYVYIGSTRTLIRTDHRTMVHMYLANVMLSFMCSFGLSLLFESPFMALEKVLFEILQRKKPSQMNKENSEIEKNMGTYEKTIQSDSSKV